MLLAAARGKYAWARLDFLMFFPPLDRRFKGEVLPTGEKAYVVCVFCFSLFFKLFFFGSVKNANPH